MRKKYISAIVIVSILLVSGFWFFLDKSSKSIPKVKSPQQTNEASQAHKQRPSKTSAQITPEQKKINDMVEALKRDPDLWWKTPISFYGKVVDENNQPVYAANIEFTVDDKSFNGAKYNETSNNQGLFSLIGVKGRAVDVRVSKEGYYTSKNESFSFLYAGAGELLTPDPNNPVVFHLKKKGEAEGLIKRYSKIPLARNGTVTKFDLLEGKTSKTGQLELQAWESKKNAEGRFDWKLVIRVPSGGIKSSDEEFPFLAPESDYTQTLEIDMPVSLGNDWRGSIEKQAYVVFGTPPKYARINIRMSGHGENFYMDSYLNPTGSRNLEYDPAKEIKAK